MPIKVDKNPDELMRTQETDAMAWAVAFNKINPQVEVDIMLAWFANAMFTMHDKHANKDQKLISKLKQLIYLTDPSVPYEMNPITIAQVTELSRWEEEQKFK